MTIVEEIARVLCWKNGMDPDLSLGGDKQNWLWMEYEGQAQAALAVILKRLREPDDRLRDLLTLTVCRASQHETELVHEAVLNALATHIEKE